MKIEVAFDGLDAVLRKMGIKGLVADEHRMTWEINRDIDLEIEGIDVRRKEIKEDPNGTLSYEGRKILVYIRDQPINDINNPPESSTYKFHVANCQTIDNMQSAGRFTRYVASTRHDGNFIVNFMQSGKIIQENQIVEMHVCRNCLRKLNYKGYDEEPRGTRDEIYNEFSLEQFFERYGETTVTEPQWTDITGPIDAYSLHRAIFSRICRERARWKCEECRISLEDKKARQFLHAHHIDGAKSNNRSANLRALCVDCHDKQAGHSLPPTMREKFHDWKRRSGTEPLVSDVSPSLSYARETPERAYSA